MQVTVDDFNASQSRIWVELIPTTAVDRKTLVATSGGVPPDIAGLWDVQLVSFLEMGVITPLDALMREYSIDPGIYIPSVWEMIHHNGKTMGLVSTPATTALHWNKGMFRAAGMDPERPPRTFKELEDFSKRLTKVDAKTGEILQMGFLPAEPGWWNYGWGYFFGGSLWDKGQRITADDPKNVQSLEWVRRMAEPYQHEALQSFRSGFGNFASSQNPFMAGKLAMVLQGVWMANYMALYAPKVDWAAAPFPVVHPGDPPITFMGCDVLSIPVGAKHPREAFEFIAYVQRQEVMEKLCKAHRKTSGLRKVSQAFYEGHGNPYIRMFQELSWSKGAVSPPKMSIFTEYGDELNACFDRVWQRKQEPAAALAQTQARIQKSWNRELDRRSHPPNDSLRHAPLALSVLAVLVLAGVVFVKDRQDRRFTAAGRLKGKLRRGLLFAAPGLIGLLVFTVYPICAAFIYGFCDYSVLSTPRWVGLDNFKELAGDQLFWLSLKNTLYYASFALPLGLLLALISALLLDSNVRGAGAYRTFFFLPVVTPLVANAMVWLWIFNSQFGVLNFLLEKITFGHIRAVPWLTDANYTMPSLILMSFWGIGQTAVILMAALQEVPVAIYEAAELDGAGWFKKAWHISIPSISPALYFNLVMGVIGSLQIFAQPYIMMNTTGTTPGGPARSASFYTMYLWDSAFSYLRMGYASAMAWILFLIILGLNALFTRLTKSRIHYAGG